MTAPHASGPALLGKRSFIFIIGSPRSGTTWLHRMIEQHPGVATAPAELTLFSRYLAPADDGYSLERRHMDRGDWKQGLPLLFDQSEFDAGLREIIEAVYGRVLALNPQASVIVDKHPKYTYHLPLIERLVPDARFIHVLRDGRDVVVSMLSARKRRGFGAGDDHSAAREWADSVRMAREHGARVGGDRWVELRYEDLMMDTAELLEKVFAFCGLPADRGLCERIAAKYHISQNQVSSGDSALNAQRAVAGGIWSSRLSLEQRYIIDRVAGRKLAETGYAEPGWWATGWMDRLRMRLFELRVRASRSRSALRSIWRSPIHHAAE